MTKQNPEIMSNTKFTQGPWDVNGSGRLIVHTICGSIYAINGTFEYDEKQEVANAHLIAAAPELYKELERLVFVFGNKFPDEVEAAKAALLKAQGGN